MIRKYHNHTLHTNSWHIEEEPQNTACHKTSGRQLKQSNQLSLPYQDGCKTRWAQSTEFTKQGSNTEPPRTMGATTNNQSTTTEPPP